MLPLLLIPLLSLIVIVEAANYGVYRDEEIDLDLLIVEGGDETETPDLDLNLTLAVAMVNINAYNSEPLNLTLMILIGESQGLIPASPLENLGLTLDFARGGLYNLIMLWDPYDQPKLTGKNYTYLIHIGLEGVDLDNYMVVVRFEGSYVTEKETNATGQFDFWAIVGSPGIHTWTFTIYDLDGEEDGVLWKDTEYVEGGPGPGPDPPPGPGPDMPDLPTAPGSLFGVFDFLPLMVVFGIFGFIGNLIVGRVGVLFGAVAALFLTTAMGTIPAWVLYFVILVTIIVVAYKLKTGGSNVTVNNGGVSA